MATPLRHAPDDDTAAELYRAVVWHLREGGIPYLVGGTYALEHHADVRRDTKDLDLFIRRADWSRVERTLHGHGIRCELVFSHWLGKATQGRHYVDVIFAGGNGLVEVDEEWLVNGVPAVILDVPVHLVAAEDMIWSKAFVMERERFDGADVLHIIRKSGQQLNWDRLIRRFGHHTPVLTSHLMMYQFVYPGERAQVPNWVLDMLWERARDPESVPTKLCRGPLVSREQYLVDILEWGYIDARQIPHGRMTFQQIQDWTRAIGDDKSSKA